MLKMSTSAIFKKINNLFVHKNMAWFFLSYYLCLISFFIGIIGFGIMQTNSSQEQSLIDFSIVIVCLLGLSSAVRYFKKPRIGLFEMIAFIGAPVLIFSFISVIIYVIKEGVTIYLGKL